MNITITLDGTPNFLNCMGELIKAFNLTVGTVGTAQMQRQDLLEQPPLQHNLPQQQQVAQQNVVQQLATQKPPMQQNIPQQQQVTQQSQPAQQAGVYQQQLSSTPLPTATPQAYDIEQLSAASATLMDAGRQPELINLLGHFGVPAITMLPPERYGEFATALRNLGARI